MPNRFQVDRETRETSDIKRETKELYKGSIAIGSHLTAES